MKGTNKSNSQVTVHKEEMLRRMIDDAKDRKAISDKLSRCIDPRNPADHPSALVNIVSGLLATEAVNVDDAVTFGKEQWNNYESRLTDDFYS